MTTHSPKESEIEHFNALAAGWNNSEEAVALAQKVLQALGIKAGQSLLDVASGTGVIPAALHKLGIRPSRYLALDISSAMLEALREGYPEAETQCVDFEDPFTCESGFDYVLIYNSIPHFVNLEMLFANAERSLNPGGTFMIAHSRTRQGLKEHHARIGYSSMREPIPPDQELIELAVQHGFDGITIEDEELYCFSCSRVSL
ncbi:methyltransferase domain-containing protein [Paenibacillus sp. FSL L8-0340]|uniref:class I SAM-dependent methyltransferase n=1 Tax=Paenibacillus sp. FSL L8-0340 TaxID=2954685 RepID=UPI003158E9E1